MKIDHVHFYVEDANTLCNWLVQVMGFQSLVKVSNDRTYTAVVQNGPVCLVLSSPLQQSSPVAEYLRLHPPGVVDLAFGVQDVAACITRASQQGARILQPVQVDEQTLGCLKWGQVAGWGALKHTLIERRGLTSCLPSTHATDFSGRENPLPGTPASIGQPALEPVPQLMTAPEQACNITFNGIDHVVLNVAAGDLPRAVAWYTDVLGFQPQQTFTIQTDLSALHSQVLMHPDGFVRLPINEPGSANSQIQEFLDINRGPGIQHIALQTCNIIPAIAQLRQLGLPLLSVPATYYTQLRQRYGFCLSEADWQAIAAQQILVDWQAETAPALLLQTFTQPIFQQPTFFFELIERQVCCVNGQLRQVEGFGEGNFRALFEAMEREQIKRGSL